MDISLVYLFDYFYWFYFWLVFLLGVSFVREMDI